MTEDEAKGMAWWNSLDETERAFYLKVAELNSTPHPSAADAWHWFKIMQVRDMFAPVNKSV
jgi:hypothetical protein